MLKRGQRFGVYEVRASIGRGGMGEVYRARHVDLGRTVALKTIRPSALVTHSEPELLKDRFLREMKIHGTLTHPSLVRVYDLGFIEDQPYIAMEFMHGGSLRGKLASEPGLGAFPTIEILTSLADGLEALHAAGIVHRDVKPANVMFDRTGRARLTDFGLSRHLESTVLTQVEDFIGTPAYMPREVLGEGEALGVDSDVYALGVVGYELLAGEIPWAFGSVPDLLKQICYSDPRPLAAVNPDVDDELGALMDRMVSPRPGDRLDLAGLQSELRRIEGRLLKLTSPALVLPDRAELGRATDAESGRGPEEEEASLPLASPGVPVATPLTLKLSIVLLAGSGFLLLMVLLFRREPRGLHRIGRTTPRPSVSRTVAPTPPVRPERVASPAPPVGSPARDPKVLEAFEKEVNAALRIADAQGGRVEPDILVHLPAIEQLRIAVTQGNEWGPDSPLWVDLDDAADRIVGSILAENPLTGIPHSLTHALEAVRRAAQAGPQTRFRRVFHDNLMPLMDYVQNPLRAETVVERRAALAQSQLRLTRDEPDWAASRRGLQHRVRLLELATRDSVHDTQRPPRLLFEETETARRVLERVAREYFRVSDSGPHDARHAQTLARIIIGLVPRQEIEGAPEVPRLVHTAVARLNLEDLDGFWRREVAGVLRYLPRN